VLETMIEGVMVVDGREHLVYANPAARTLLEIPERTRPGRPLLEAVRSPGIEVAVQAALATGRLHQSELDLPRKDRTVALTASPLVGSAASGVVLVLQDVTELRRLERVRREFVSNVSHELKTPLTHIQAYADTLAEGAIDDPDNCRKFLDRIIEQAVRLQALIADLLQLARIESQDATVDLEPLELGAAAVRCVEEHEAEATTSGISLSVECRSEATVLADAKGLQQIVDNLVANALKYTPAGGSVTVVVSSSDGSGILEVIDTGIGISREDQLRVFERFYRVDRARTRAVGGTGLGLAIVKHLVQSYEGRIELSSELGRGSRFTVRIPLIDQKNGRQS
jgi:two-component system phosphate regulon sensor histidine kinase PhoR